MGVQPLEPGEGEDDEIYADLSNASFDEFVRFWFDRAIDPRAVGPQGDSKFAWYCNIEIRFEPQSYAENFIRLFNAPEFLLERYSKGQLEEGFWAMVSPMATGGIDAVILSARLPWDTRERLLNSMYELFAKLFAREPLQSASYMWWDLLGDCVEFAAEAREGEIHDAERLRDAMFGVLCQILDVDAESCQLAALHGLKDLKRPRGPAVVQEWLSRHPGLPQKLVDYAQSCLVLKPP